MGKELELRITEQPYTENGGVISTDIQEITTEPTVEEKNMELLEQINYKLDLLLSIREEEKHG